MSSKEKAKKNIESVFRSSSSHDELFDAFRSAIENRIEDSELYKILLWNKILSTDELRMYAEKLCREFPAMSFSIYFEVAKLLESISVYGGNLELALEYYKKSSEVNPSSFLPYTAAAVMYNKDLDLPKFEKVADFLQSGIELVERKSKLCFNLVNLYKKFGNREKERKYQRMGEKYQKEGK